MRLAAVKVGLTKFNDYLVLGDDIVIARKQVALKYQELIEQLGVGISLHKSIVPSEEVGLEFASKLISKLGNLSPLPVILLLKEGIVSKLQFLTEVVDRLVSDGVQRAPDLDCLLTACFGKRLKDILGSV